MISPQRAVSAAPKAARPSRTVGTNVVTEHLELVLELRRANDANEFMVEPVDDRFWRPGDRVKRGPDRTQAKRGIAKFRGGLGRSVEFLRAGRS